MRRKTLVEFESPEELATRLDAGLTDALNDLAIRQTLPRSHFARRVRELREQLSIHPRVLAQAIGLSEAAVESLENGPDHRVNPSMTIVRRIAAFLKTSPSYLIDGVDVHPEDSDPVLKQSRESLHTYAVRCTLSHEATERLWTDFVLEYQSQRRAVAEARTEPIATQDWEQRHRSGRERQLGLGLDDEED